MTATLSRRAFLIGCSAAASPLLSPVTFAAAPGDKRLVVILLRGAMDGLDMVRPRGDAGFAALRPRLALDLAASADLDGYFALHPAAAPLLPLWQAGEMAFVQAVATPYRRGRSHFIAQDALENGTGGDDGQMTASRDGWLNRALSLIPGAKPDLAVSVGQERLLILDGPQQTSHWFPVEQSPLSSQGQALLAALHHADPLFARPYDAAVALALATSDQKPAGTDLSHKALGTHVAERLQAEARIASFSIGGWDMHQNQVKTMTERLHALTQTLLALKSGLGSAWGSTLVLAMTEFGRTVRENGSGGTDHGTGGMLIALGGMVRGGRVLGDWPGIGADDLLGERDLLPTGDLRRYPAWALRSLFGVGAAGLETVVFPGLDLQGDPGLIL